jgi:hypothetical protein
MSELLEEFHIQTFQLTNTTVDRKYIAAMRALYYSSIYSLDAQYLLSAVSWF